MSDCPCGSGRSFARCCEPLLEGQTAATAEALMRSRYTAYVAKRIEYLKATLHPDYRHDYDPAATRRWIEQAQWVGLEIRRTEQGGEHDQEGNVEFIATYREKDVVRTHHEISSFRKHDGQ